MKMYHHVIEEGHYGNIGTHGYYEKVEDAKKRVDDLQDMFPKLFFYVYSSYTKEEPEFITI